MTNLDTGQRRVERLAATLLAFVPGHFGLGRTFFFLRRLRGRRCHGFGLIEKQVLLLRASRLALGGEQLTLEGLELFQEQVSLDRHHTQLALDCLAFREYCLELALGVAQQLQLGGGNGDGRGWHGRLDRCRQAAFTPRDGILGADACALPLYRCPRAASATVRPSA